MARSEPGIAVSPEWLGPGTLPKPGRIGRSVRLLSGVLVLVLFLTTAIGYRLGESPDPSNPFDWLGLAFLLWSLPGLVNLGFGRRWGQRPRLVGAGVLVAAGLLDLVRSGTFLGPVFDFALVGGLLYVLAHLGVSLLLAGATAAPGCEMRSIPHVLGRMRGREAAEYP